VEDAATSGLGLGDLGVDVGRGFVVLTHELLGNGLEGFVLFELDGGGLIGRARSRGEEPRPA
jgi:hypothetical protein